MTTDQEGRGGDSRLSPCPFCGSDQIEATDCSNMQTNGDRIYCAKCGASIEGYGGSTSWSKAIAAWNRRAESRAEGRAGGETDVATENYDDPMVQRIAVMLENRHCKDARETAQEIMEMAEEHLAERIAEAMAFALKAREQKPAAPAMPASVFLTFAATEYIEARDNGADAMRRLELGDHIRDALRAMKRERPAADSPCRLSLLCDASKADGIVCPDDSCDIADGIRQRGLKPAEDEDCVERVARAIYAKNRHCIEDGVQWEQTTDWVRERMREYARAAIAAVEGWRGGAGDSNAGQGERMGE